MMKPYFKTATVVALAVMLALLASSLVSSCSKPKYKARNGDSQTKVRIENQNWLDMTIYVVSGSQRVRLGTVTGATTREYVLPSHVLVGVTSLRFITDPVGGRGSSISHEVELLPGEVIELVIPN